MEFEMHLRIVSLPPLFRPNTSHHYPPFVRGRYLEKYVYDVLMSRVEEIVTDLVYIPVFWTNLQNHPGFSNQRRKYQMLLDQALRIYPMGTRFVTCVQHDDGPCLSLPADSIVYGCCTGGIPLPLIYEDTTQRLLHETRLGKYVDDDGGQKRWLASFVGTLGTHPVRAAMARSLQNKKGVMISSRGAWSVAVEDNDAERFIHTTRHSRFCLAPRGYGRSSFRFFEAMLLDVVPVYIWDDVEWLPYQDVLDYSRFCISVHISELDILYDRLAAVTEEEYDEMVNEIRRVRSWFTLEGMCEWLVGELSHSK